MNHNIIEILHNYNSNIEEMNIGTKKIYCSYNQTYY